MERLMKQDGLRHVAHEASFLHERLTGDWLPQPDQTKLWLAQQRLERWRATAAGGDWNLFAERLAWVGLDVTQALALLGPGKLAAWEKSPPPWLAILAEALAQETPDSLLRPFTAVAEQRLQQAIGLDLTPLSPAARDNLRACLVNQLGELAAPTLTYAGAISLTALCEAYPVLARQMATKVGQWVAEIGDFYGRIHADWPHLTQAPLRAGTIAALRPNLSDPHHGGRAVWRVELANGQTFAYKPKEISLDCAWYDLLVWANQRGLDPQLTSLWTLPRAGYGWMAWVDERPICDAPRYYRRMGLLLGWLHLLHAADAHHENLVGSGDCPLLVDAEMLVYPQVTGQERDDPLNVLRMGLLPRWLVGAQGTAEIGGLPGESDRTAENQAEIIAGYQAIGRFATEQWIELKAGPLVALQRGNVRFAPRPTAAYARLLTHLRHPAFLGNGMAFSVELDSLARTYLRPEKAAFRSLLMAEHTAVSQGDVPFFTAHIGQPDLRHSHGIITQCFTWPPFTRPDPTSQAQQSALIRASLDRAPYLPPAPATFLATACVLGQLLADRAAPLGSSQDGLGWAALQWQAKSGLYQHGLVGDDLYAGRAGIALFLAALARVTGKKQWGELALAGLRGGLRGEEKTADPGGRLYTLSLIADLLEAPHLIEEALALARQARPLEQAGVVDGQMGMALGLLKLRQVVGDTAVQAEIMAAAERWGQAALTGWEHSAEAKLGGFSHGAAGIAYGLARLYAASGKSRFRDGARQLWAYQQTLYDEQADNWQDRRGSKPAYLLNWCNGAAGIGLAAVGGAHLLPEANMAVERAATQLMAAPEAPYLDTLCCGGFGQIACLQEMGLRFGRQAWLTAAAAQADRLLARGATAGYFQLYDNLPPVLFNPTFFRGVAGIGYALLRLADPDKQLPCVLSMA